MPNLPIKPRIDITPCQTSTYTTPHHLPEPAKTQIIAIDPANSADHTTVLHLRFPQHPSSVAPTRPTTHSKRTHPQHLTISQPLPIQFGRPVETTGLSGNRNKLWAIPLFIPSLVLTSLRNHNKLWSGQIPQLFGPVTYQFFFDSIPFQRYNLHTCLNGQE